MDTMILRRKLESQTRDSKDRLRLLDQLERGVVGRKPRTNGRELTEALASVLNDKPQTVRELLEKVSARVPGVTRPRVGMVLNRAVARGEAKARKRGGLKAYVKAVKG